MQRYLPCTLWAAALCVACTSADSDDTKSISKTTSPVTLTTTVTIDTTHLGQFRALSDINAAGNDLNDPVVDIGRSLFFEKALSADKKTSCNTCHDLRKFGVDNLRRSKSATGSLTQRNTPSIYNAGAHFAQGWDGRDTTLESQIRHMILSPQAMGLTNEEAVARVLARTRKYAASFENAFPNQKNKINFENTANALGAFVRTLTTPASWDRFLEGDKQAIEPVEKSGFNKFVAVGCHSCHSGALIGGETYQKLGLAKPWPDTSDTGRYQVTKRKADRMFFIVPSLRNVEKTAPYFHDGSEPRLTNAIVRMAYHQLGQELPPSDARSIVTWLKTLTGSSNVTSQKNERRR